ncbi:MAG: RCC1 domain-containing protein [Candidatus Polarisedimenticolia bacterium]
MQRTFSLSLLLILAALLPAGRSEAGSIVRLGPCATPHCNVPPPNSGFVAVATGNYHSMGLRPDGSIAAWGMCDVEQCGVPSPNSGFTAIAAGDSHSLALRPDGSIAAFGSDEQGQLNVPSPNTGYVAISAGLLHSLALRSDGSIVGWGRNVSGETIPPTPNTGWVAIAAGGYVSMGLKSDGSIRKWGCGGTCEVPSPNTGFVAIATSFDHSLALRADGSIVGWGSNAAGQLDVPEPNTGFVAIAAGIYFSMGVKADGSLWAWGRIDQNYVPLPNEGYQAMTGNGGGADALKSVASDSDGDGMTDALDCAPADLLAFAIPGEVRDLRFDTGTLLAWTTETGRSGMGTNYDIVRGPLSGLPVEPGSGESCRVDGIFLTNFSDTAQPAAGTGFYYLVRAANNCGNGTYGFATSGTERTTAACP